MPLVLRLRVKRVKAEASTLGLRERIGTLARRSPKALQELPAGLGHRRFFRVRFDDDDTPLSIIARVEGRVPEDGGVGPEPELEPIRAFLAAAGLPVPRSYADDGQIQLLEDLGDHSLEKLAAEADPPKAHALYAEACSLIPRLQSLTRPRSGGVPAFERQWDRELVATKARKWLDWSFPLIEGRSATEPERDAIKEAFAFVARACESAPRRLAHRDFKAANLHFRSEPDSSGLVMIDLQGALLAPPEYDLVCLLRDAHVALSEAQVQAHLAEIRPQLPDSPDEHSFLRRFDLITLARVSKDLSHYLYAASQRGDRRYLCHVPNALANLREAAVRARPRDPEIGPLADVIERAPADLDVSSSLGAIR